MLLSDNLINKKIDICRKKKIIIVGIISFTFSFNLYNFSNYFPLFYDDADIFFFVIAKNIKSNRFYNRVKYSNVNICILIFSLFLMFFKLTYFKHTKSRKEILGLHISI